jgi:hypothetical protein
MKVRYYIYIFATAAINLFAWYYIIIFCVVYAGSARGWLFSVIQGLILDLFVFELIHPIGIVAIRIICKAFPGMK